MERLSRIRGMEARGVRLVLAAAIPSIPSIRACLLSRFSAFFAVTLFILHCADALHAAAAEGQVLDSPYVFTTDRAVFRLPKAVGKAKCMIRTITFSGWGPTKEETLSTAGGRLEVTPLAEGIHIVTVEGVPGEYRFLAFEPPPPLANFGPLVEALRHSGRKLLTKENYTILAMNDTETDAADYQIILGMLLKRVTGNANITFVDRSQFGRTVDAAVRRFKEDVLRSKPDLGLVLYGRADQAQSGSLDGYLEGCRALAERLAKECNADTLFLQPTPDLDMALDPAEQRPGSHSADYALRTLGYAEALRPLAAELNVTVADTFLAFWGRGAKSMPDSVRAMWSLFPPGSHQQLKSLIETGGKGGTLYPNALGNLAIARAVLRALCGPKELAPLAVSGYSEWVEGRLVAHVRVRNVSGVRRIGRVEVYPLPDDTIASPSPIAYNIAHTESVEFDVTWPKLKRPEDLAQYPADRYLAPGTPQVPVVDFLGDQSRAYLAACPFEPSVAFVRERLVAEGGEARVKVLRRTVEAAASEDPAPRKGGGLGEEKEKSPLAREKTETLEHKVPIPRDSAVGRIPLVARFPARNNVLWAVAELAYVRYGAASKGEAEVDGKLDEWAESAWVPVGEPCQARSPRGPEDHRASKDECYVKWAFKAGDRGVYLAFDAVGKLDKDQFTLFFDPRPPALLGTAGRYYWVHGTLETWGKIRLDPGDTSPATAFPAGAWKSDGARATGELLIPYDLFESKGWPASGDLGLSIWWAHTGPSGQVTHLYWSDDGYPWSPRWYGVVRLTDKADAPLPCMVRIK